VPGLPIESIDLSIHFGGHFAVNEVSCGFDEKTLTAIVGPNGAGKTTYFNLLSGQLKPSSGKVLIRGADVTGKSASERSRLGVARGFQLTNLFPNLTVLENVRLAVQANKRPAVDFTSLAPRDQPVIDQARACLDTVGLLARADDLPVVLSHGGQRRLEFTLLLAMERPIWLLDEPTAGMAAEDVERITALIKRVSENRTVLMVEHNLSVVATLCDRITVLARGQVLAEGDYATVSRDPRVLEAYIGTGHG
jgi:branched-chain amino acid transport system ATP-binding protein